MVAMIVLMTESALPEKTSLYSDANIMICLRFFFFFPVCVVCRRTFPYICFVCRTWYNKPGFLLRCVLESVFALHIHCMYSI